MRRSTYLVIFSKKNYFLITKIFLDSNYSQQGKCEARVQNMEKSFEPLKDNGECIDLNFVFYKLITVQSCQPKPYCNIHKVFLCWFGSKDKLGL